GVPHRDRGALAERGAGECEGHATWKIKSQTRGAKGSPGLTGRAKWAVEHSGRDLGSHGNVRGRRTRTGGGRVGSLSENGEGRHSPWLRAQLATPTTRVHVSPRVM